MKKSIFLMVATSMLACLGCSKDDEMMQKPLDGQESAVLSITETELPPLGNAARTFNFNSTEAWEISDVPSWISVKPSSGRAGNYEITVDCTEIGEASDYKDNLRSCTLNFVAKSDKHQLQQFEIRQQRPYVHTETVEPYVEEDFDNVYLWYDYGENGKPLTVKVESNIQWDYALNESDKFIISKVEEEQDKNDRFLKRYTFTVIPKTHNIDKVAYTYALSIFGLDDTKSELKPEEGKVDYGKREWSLKQKNLRFLINDTPEDITLDMGQLTAKYKKYDTDTDAKSGVVVSGPEQTVSVDTEIPWESLKFDNGAKEWLDYKDSKKDSTINFAVSHVNVDKSNRESSIVISATIDGALVSRTVNFTQHPYEFTLSDASDCVIGNEDSEHREFDVQTKGPWKVTWPDKWINISIDGEVLSGDAAFNRLGTSSVDFYAPQQSLDFNDLTGNFQITGIDGVSLFKNIIQDKFLFDIAEQKEWDGTENTMSNLGDMLSRDMSDHTINLTTSGEWDVVVTDKTTGAVTDWITIPASTEKATDPTSVFATPKNANPNMEKDREAVITFTSRRHVQAIQSGKISSLPEQAKVEIVAKQSHYIFRVNGFMQVGQATPVAFDTDKPLSVPAYKKESTVYTFSVESSESDKVTVEFIPDVTGKVPFKKKVDVATRTSKDPRGKESHINYYPFTLEKNTGTTNVTGKFVIKCYYNDGSGVESALAAEQEVIVNQDAFLFDLTGDDFSDGPVGAATRNIEFNLTKEAGWIATPSAGWMICSSASGESDGIVKLTIKPENNPTLSDRSGYVTIEVDPSIASGKSAKFNFVQDKYVFGRDAEISQTFKELGKADGSSVKESFDFEVTSSGPWTVSNSNDWIVVTPQKGTGNQKVKVEVNTNTSAEKRSGSFKVEADVLNEKLSVDKDDLTKTVSISQLGYQWDVTAGDSYSFDPVEDSGHELKIKSSGPWTASAGSGWVITSETSGDGSQSGSYQTISLKASHNRSDSDRKAVLTISANGTSFSKAIDVSQHKFVLLFDRSSIQTDGPLDVKERTAAIETSTSNISVVSSDESVLKLNRDGNVLTLLPQKNIATSKRNATVTLTNSDCDFKRTITFNQAAYTFTSNQLVQFNELSPSQQTISVSASNLAKWKAEKTDANSIIKSLSQSYTNGSDGDGQVVVELNDNNVKKARSASITLTSEDNPNLKINIPVSQAAYRFAVTSPAPQKQTAVEKKSETISIDCSDNGPWTVTSKPDWITVSNGSGIGSKSFTIQPNSINVDDKNERQGIVAITSGTNPEYVETVTLVQNPYEFKVESSTLKEFAEVNPLSQSISVVSSGDWKAEISEDAGGMLDTPERNGSILTIKAHNNLTSLSRSAKIKVSTTDGSSHSAEFTVTQKAYEWSVVNNLSSKLSAGGGSWTIEIKTSSESSWTIETPEWVKINKNAGKGNSTVTASVSLNDLTSERAGYVVVKSSDAPNTFKSEFSVSQEPFYYGATADNKSFSSASGTINVEIVTVPDAKWSLSTDSNWLTKTTSSGTGNKNVQVQVASNGGTSERTGKVTVVFLDNPDYSVDITITQQGQPEE